GLVAVLAIAVGGKGQRLGDMVAGTSVVKPTAQSGMAASEIFVTPGEGYVPTFGQVIQLTETI
ncbi:MAG TPA: RDD family protein, partial [Cyclobacteriaceae bacterium]|nr:RDD family protein [Cyclobacteriaceae bacterium]